MDDVNVPRVNVFPWIQHPVHPFVWLTLVMQPQDVMNPRHVRVGQVASMARVHIQPPHVKMMKIVARLEDVNMELAHGDIGK
jgi:hypothetical protein